MTQVLARLSEALTARAYESRPVLVPLVHARLGVGNVTPHRLDALVDTGAIWTLAPMSLARRLGLDPSTLRRTTDSVAFRGASGGDQRAYGQRVRLVLGRNPRTQVELDDVPVYFTDAHLADYDLVLGQHGVLERLTVVQLPPPTPRVILERRG